MKKDIEVKIKELMGELNCPKNFKCAEQGFEHLCEAEDLGLDDLLKCLDVDPLNCTFALPFGKSHFCSCPLRVYIAKKLGK